MLVRLRSSAGYALAWFHFRKSTDKVISFTQSFTAAHEALLVMPLDHGDLLPTVSVIEALRAQFREQNITIVTSAHSVEVMRLLPRSRVVRLQKQDTDLFFRPTKDVLASVAGKPYDLAIDLNLDFVLPSGYICRESGARVRIGFTRPHADTFYNFLVRPDPTLSRHHVYDRLARCLHMF